MTNEDDNDQALLDIHGRFKGAMIAPIIVPILLLPRSSLPAPQKSNIGLPRALQLPQPSEIGVSPIFQHPIPIPRLALGYPPPWLIYRDDDLTTPIFDIGESTGEVHFLFRSLHCCENSIDASPTIFPIPPMS
ncbi:hypothetical protein EV421DRAFT_1910716 [Armillaria borealis]|uniref:Uncharacterized protein n=1 Tax=Armillaria borealis TaxID=47425 RepID=A0AA39J0V0_9AGAR|nr:hypothetical protein EV421DRAFT_1910716 [Armillaria borealis]